MLLVNSVALRTSKTLCSFEHSECNRVNELLYMCNRVNKLDMDGKSNLLYIVWSFCINQLEKEVP